MDRCNAIAGAWPRRAHCRLIETRTLSEETGAAASRLQASRAQHAALDIPERMTAAKCGNLPGCDAFEGVGKSEIHPSPISDRCERGWRQVSLAFGACQLERLSLLFVLVANGIHSMHAGCIISSWSCSDFYLEQRSSGVRIPQPTAWAPRPLFAITFCPSRPPP